MAACIPGSLQFTAQALALCRVASAGQAGLRPASQASHSAVSVAWGTGTRDSQHTAPDMFLLAAHAAALPTQACARLLSAACTPSRHGTTHARGAHTSRTAIGQGGGAWICMHAVQQAPQRGCTCGLAGITPGWRRPSTAAGQEQRSNRWRSPNRRQRHPSSALRRPCPPATVRSHRHEHPPAWTCGSVTIAGLCGVILNSCRPQTLTCSLFS